MLNEVLKKTAWAILPDSLEQIYTILRENKLGKTDLEAIEAKLGKNLANKREVTIEDGVAVIPIVGPIARRMNVFQAISGGTSAEMLIKDIEAALANEDVKAILFNIDSPGGTVDGTKEVADLIFESRGTKPIWAFTSGTMASGAYWLGSQAERVSAFDTASIGSIGVVMSHYDYSAADEKEGVKRTFITAGKYKRIVNDAEPLSDEGRAYLQEMLDDYYSLFLDAVAQGRGIEKNTVLKDMADGKMFIASKALDRNMVDAIESIEVTIKLLKEEVNSRGEVTVEEAKNKLNVKEGGITVNLDQLKTEHPELVAQIQEDAKKELAADFAKTETALKEENAGLKADHETLASEVQELKKKDAIRHHNEMAVTAKGVWDSKLAQSSVPESLWPNVRPSVKHTNFIEADTFDVAGFEKAVDTEISDWEANLSKTYGEPRVLGNGVTRKTEVAEEAEVDDSDDWAKRMLGLAGDKEAVAAMSN